MNHSDFKNQVDNLMNILFGSGVANHSTIIEQINYLVFLRSLAKRDDEAINLDDDDRVLFKGKMSSYKWDNLLMLNAEVLFSTLEELYKQVPELAKDVTVKMLYRDAHVKVYDKPTLRRLVHEIEKMMSDLEKEAASGHKDIFGDMYEYLLGKLSQAGTLGSFRTPRHIIKFIVDVIDPAKGETILDPACGTAGFLVAALEHLKHKYTSKDYIKRDKFPMDKLEPRERKFIYQHALTGFDSDFDMFKFGLMNLYLHQLEHPQIKRINTLVDTAGDRTKYDVILANPPFAGALDNDSISEDIRMGTRATEILFLRFMIDHLSPNGRAGVIVPEGIIFSGSNAHKKIRQMLIEEAGLWCVVSLPSGIFNPYAGVKTSIVFFNKIMLKKTKDILFVKVQNDGLDLGAQRRPIEQNDLPKGLEIISNYKANIDKQGKHKFKGEEIAHLVSKTRIIESGDYNLSEERYRIIEARSHQKWPIFEIGEITEVSAGNSAPQDPRCFINGTHQFFRTSDIGAVHISSNLSETRDKLNEKGVKGLKLFPKGTILFPKSGASTFLNHRVVMGVDGYVSSHLSTISPTSNILPLFLFYLLCQVDAKKITNNQNYPSLRLSQIAKIKIPLPPLEVQKQIVEELDGYQKIIDGARAVVENWRPSFEIDPGWETKKLREVCEINPKKSEIKGLINTTEVSFVPMEDIKENQMYFVPRKIKTIEEAYKGYTYFKENDVLVAKVTPCFENGKAGIAKNLKSGIGFGSSEIHVIRPNEKILAEFIYPFVSSKSFKEKGKKLMTGTGGLQRLPASYIENLDVPLLPIEIQKQIVAKIEEEQKIVEANKKLMGIYEQKIKDKLAEVWGEN